MVLSVCFGLWESSGVAAPAAGGACSPGSEADGDTGGDMDGDVVADTVRDADDDEAGWAVVVAAVACPTRPVMISTMLIAKAFRVCDSRIKRDLPRSVAAADDSRGEPVPNTPSLDAAGSYGTDGVGSWG
ncbi:hypothetical protein GCM10009828_031510 [Actinoplanes couchii]|uniref:Secreted protein n=1 Tax=Actinoplanes couchii TaxID=403638 RepID=A0ABQ3XBJ3_9ACTN|nr:hypothetical protein Aco03nite_042860 [Actinoplanes couchii]